MSVQLFILLTFLLGEYSTHANYNPAEDDTLDRSDDDVIVMKAGRPDMRHFQSMIEKQAFKNNEEEFEEVDIPPDELMDDEEVDSEDEQAELNGKRFVMDNPHKLWDFGILPYKFDASLSNSSKKNILEVVIPKYEYWTHFRLMEWNSSVPKLYNLTHHNYLLFTQQNGCWSHVGNNKHGHGQKLSCCKGSACVHEIGHAIGFHHEQSNPLRDDNIRINYENIAVGKASNFGLKSLRGNRGFGYFDIGSIMEYGIMAFNKNKKNTITVYDPDLEYLIKHQDTSAFYMFYEAQTLYKMKDQMCPNFPIRCINDGYVSYINNTCKCRCPTGMDARTGCATPTMADVWPEGSYSLLKPMSGCPPGFQDGELKLWKKLTLGHSSSIAPSSLYHHVGSFNTNYTLLSFCTKLYQHMPGTAPQWSSGKYCLIKSTGACPNDFKTRKIELGSGELFSNVSSKGVTPEYTFEQKLNITLCCRTDGQVNTPMKMPIQKPVVLMALPEVDYCQTVEEAAKTFQQRTKQYTFVRLDLNVEQDLCGMITECFYKSMTVHNESVSWIMGDGQTPWSICYYNPVSVTTAKKRCGDVIYLSDSNPLVRVTSPGYPQDYNSSHACTWFVKGPSNSKIVMEFSDFSVHGKTLQSCNGHLELRYYLPGEPGITYCGSGFNKTIISDRNTLNMILSSQTTSASHHKRFLLTPSGSSHVNTGSRRFDVTFKLLREEDLCYTNQGKDNSYLGKINYGHNFERCLPWDEVTNCPHHVFNEMEHALEGNYCRNPGYGTEPWCYTNAETCARAFCDSCQLRRCFDLFTDCAQQISKHTSYCANDPEAIRGCRKTCGLCSTIPKSGTVATKTCQRPSQTLPDGHVFGHMKSYYSVGENVTYVCDIDGNETRIITCSSGGTWTHLAYVCGGCPHGWRIFEGYCYKLIKRRLTKHAAIDQCNKEKDGAIVSPAESKEETDYLRKLAGSIRIWLGGHSVVSNGHNSLVWEDGQNVNYTNWLNDTAWPYHGNKKCILMTPNETWANDNCAHRNMFVCRAKHTATQVCLDQRTDCELLIERTPDLCVKYKHTFGLLKCAKSCGLCTNVGYSRSATCKVSDHPRNASTKASTLLYHEGQVIKYACNSGYQLAEGNLIRACKLSGKFSGSPPACLAIDDMVSEVGMADIRRRHKVGGARAAYTLSNKYNKIQRHGEINAWRFYSNHGGQVALQVWRHIANGTHYKLIGQNVIADTLDDRQVTVNITKSERIHVIPGDFIGVYFPRLNHGGITYDDCNKVYDPEGGDELVLSNKPYHVYNWVTGHQYNMKMASTCKIFSLRAFIGPV